MEAQRQIDSEYRKKKTLKTTHYTIKIQNDRQEKGWLSPKSLSLEKMNYYAITFQTVSWGETNTNNVQNGKWGGDKGNGAAKQTWCPESLAIYRAVTDWWHQLAVNAGHTLLLFITGTHFVRSIPSTDMRQDGKRVLIVSGQRTHSPWPWEGVLAFITDVTNLHKLNDWKHHQSRHPCG